MTSWPGYQPAQGHPVTQGSGSDMQPRRHRRWTLLTAVAAVVLVVATGLYVVHRIRTEDDDDNRRASLPTQNLLSSSMRVQPVPGWRASAAGLGLPDGSIIAAADRAQTAFAGSLGDRGYFVAGGSGTASPQWWLIGFDVRDGHRLFAPVQLSTTAKQPECFLNGPTTLLCLYDDAQTATAWVIDAQTGSVSFTGPTELRLRPPTRNVKQVGIFAIAETDDEGVYGVGPKADTTWFVPGDGAVSTTLIPNVDAGPQTLAAQTTAGQRSATQVVFSLADGAVITPELDENARTLRAVVYPGGFAVELTGHRNGSSTATPDGIAFFNESGKRVGGMETAGELAINSPSLPIIVSSPESTVFTADGRAIAQIPDFDVRSGARVVGTQLFIDESDSPSFPRWQQFDLLTSEKGKACEVDMGWRYLGTDGSVGVFRVLNPDAGLAAKAVNLTTCETVWTLPAEVRSSATVVRVNNTLVQLSDDGTELFSLIAPN